MISLPVWKLWFESKLIVYAAWLNSWYASCRTPMWSRLHTVACPPLSLFASPTIPSRRNRTQSRPATIFFAALKKESQRDVIFNFVCIMCARRGDYNEAIFIPTDLPRNILQSLDPDRAKALQQYINSQLIHRRKSRICCAWETRILIPSGFAAQCKREREREPSTNLKLCPAATIHLY